MILSYVLLAMLIATIAVVVVSVVFGYHKNRFIRKSMSILAAITLFLGAFCMIFAGVYDNEIQALQAEYDDIMLYHGVVTACDNEEVRFGHYEKIYSFNEKYNDMIVTSGNKWFGGLIADNWSEGMSVITFSFRGAEYYVGG